MKTNSGFHIIFTFESIFYLTIVQSQKLSFSLTEIKNPNEYQWSLLGSSEVWGPQLCSAYCASNVNCDAYTIYETENSQKTPKNNFWGNNKYTCQLRQISSEADSSNEEAIGTTFQVIRGSTKLVSKIRAAIASPNNTIANNATVNTDTTHYAVTATSDSITNTSTSSVTIASTPTVTMAPSTGPKGCLPCSVSSAFYDPANKRPVVICDSNDIYTLNAKSICNFTDKSTIGSKLANYTGKIITAAFNLKSNVVAFQDEGGDWYFYAYTSNAHNSIAKDMIVPDHIKINKYHFATNIKHDEILLYGENNTYSCATIDEFYNKKSKENKSQEQKNKEKTKTNNGKGNGNSKKTKKCKKNSCEVNDNDENNSQENQTTEECDKAMNKIPDASAGERIDNLYYLFQENNATTITTD